MIGHIRLDGRPYILKNPQAYRRYPANQMAPKLGQGQSEYRDLTSWEAWIVENWQAGIGQKAEDEGFLYGEVDSRVPNQLILPPALRLTDARDEVGSVTDIRYMPTSYPNTLTVGNSDVQRVSIYIKADSSLNLTALWFYASIRASITVELFAVDANKLPTGNVIDSATIAPVSNDHSFRWYKAAITETLSGVYAIVLRPTVAGTSFQLACGASYTDAVTGIYDGASWAEDTTYYPAFFTDVHKLNSGASITDVVRFHDQTYMACGNQLYKYDSTNDQWDAVGSTRSAAITDLEVVDNKLFIGLGDSTNHDTMNVSEAFSAASSAGRIFYNAGRYLWKAVSLSVYYSNNGTTWSSPISIGRRGHIVRGIAEADGDLYVATDDGLFLIAPGDVAVGITPWGAPDSGSGVDMLAHQGILYTPVAGQYLQINGGAVRNLWTIRKDELPSWASGRIVSACTTLNWPIVVVKPDRADGFASVWAWQDQGWHHLTLLPQGVTPAVIRYDRANQRLWIGTSNGLTFSIYLSNYLINPYEDPAARFAPFAWFETNWFSAGILESNKDIESLYLRSRNLTADRTIKAYWQDDDSYQIEYLGDENGDYIGDEDDDYIGDDIITWNYLGEYSEDREEKRWNLAGIRPNTREIRLGFLFSSRSNEETPKLEGHRLKFHIMIQDWLAWDLPIDVSGFENQRQQMLDGKMQNYTAAEQIAHLDSLVVGRVPPFIFMDIDGKQYEVKAKQGIFTPEKVEYFGEQLQFHGVYNVQLEAVHDAPYVPSG